MATITKRAGGWSVQVRRKGYAPEYKTLPTKEAANQWAREREGHIDRAESPTDSKLLRTLTLGDLIRRYVAEVTPTKASADTERMRLAKMLTAPMCRMSLLDLHSGMIAAYRNHRSLAVKPGTIARELGLLHTIIETARKEWGVGLQYNVVKQVRRLPLRNARNRRLEDGELSRLELSLHRSRNKLVAQVAMFAIETAMRRGELLALRWSEVNLHQRTVTIPHTKTGYSRTVPLTSAAIEILKSLRKTDCRVFPITPMALRMSWNRACHRADLLDLHFHDLRHEAISRFAEIGLTTPELAVISGHRDPRMLMRYTHLRPADLAQKLRGISWSDRPTSP